MNKIIRFLIYKNYKWQLFVKMRNPIKAGVFGVIFPLAMMLLSIAIFILLKLNLEINHYLLIPVLLIIFVYENYLINKIDNIGIETIIDEFEKWDKHREKLTTSLVLIYSLLALLSPALVAVLMLRVFEH